MRQSDSIPMIDLTRQHSEIEEELIEGFREVLATGRFILGDPVESFEAALAKLCESRHAISCNSGTDALWLALTGLGIGPGDAVLCPAFSFFATAAAILRVGATPVFLDIDPATFNLDPADAINRLDATPNARAILTADLFGRICELGPLAARCRARGIHIIEDAAQSIGAVDQLGKPPGANADVTCFSFYPTKNLGALGDAGGLVCQDPELSARIARLRLHGESEPGVYSELGINSRMDALHAVALSIKLRHLERWTRARREHAAHFDALFAAAGAQPSDVPLEDGVDRAQGELPLRTPIAAKEPARHTYHRYVVRVSAEQREPLMEALRNEGIATEVYYPRGLHQQPALADYAPESASGDAPGSNQSPLPETERASRECLALPLYPELTSDQVERIADSVIRHLTRGS